MIPHPGGPRIDKTVLQYEQLKQTQQELFSSQHEVVEALRDELGKAQIETCRVTTELNSTQLELSDMKAAFKNKNCEKDALSLRIVRLERDLDNARAQIKNTRQATDALEFETVSPLETSPSADLLSTHADNRTLPRHAKRSRLKADQEYGDLTPSSISKLRDLMSTPERGSPSQLRHRSWPTPTATQFALQTTHSRM